MLIYRTEGGGGKKPGDGEGAVGDGLRNPIVLAPSIPRCSRSDATGWVSEDRARSEKTDQNDGKGDHQRILD